MQGGELEGSYAGIIPRTVQHLFNSAAALGDPVQFSVSFFEVYRDEIYDLLHLDPEGKSIKIPGREDRHVAKIKEFVVETQLEATQVLGVGRDQRRYAPMPMNPVSSRSHGIFAIHARRQYADKSWTKSSFYFIDLMGSEAMVEDGESIFEETTAVNRDLLVLKRVITALGTKKGEAFAVPPYRESTLTWVLRDVLGGNSQAIVLLTASAHAMQYHATQNTLEFGTALKGVRREVSACMRQLGIKELEQIIEGLRQELAQGNGNVSDGDLLAQVEALEGELKVKEDKIIELEAQHETDSRLWLDEYEAMAWQLQATKDLIASGASSQVMMEQLQSTDRYTCVCG